MCAVEQVCHCQADDAGNGAGGHKVYQGLDAYGADLLHVAHRQNAVNHAQQDHRHNDEFEQIDKDVAKGFQIVGGKVGYLHRVAGKAGDDPQDQRDQDLHG